jgi:tol-pal system protein YbgF
MRVARDKLRNNGLGHLVCPNLFLLLLFIASSAFSMPVRAENTDAKLNRLENEVQTLSRAVFKGQMPPPGAMPSPVENAQIQANIDSRLAQLETDLRNLTGQLERQNFEMRTFREQIEKRMAAIEAGANAAAAGMPQAAMPGQTAGFVGGAAPVIPPGAAPAATTYAPTLTTPGQQPPATLPAQAATPSPAPLTSDDTAATTTTINPEDDDTPPAPAAPSQKTATLPDNAGATEYYENAYSLLKDQRYDEAEKAFNTFLKKFPDDNLSSNAQYWLGETYYARKDYERAARTFAEVYQKYPKSSKGPDSLLKLGMALTAMNKKSDACLTYAQLQREYTVGASAILERARTEIEALGCK